MKKLMRGTSAVEMLVVLAIVALLCTASSVALASLVRRNAMKEMSIRLYGILQVTQAEAVVSGNEHAVKFIHDEHGWLFAIYEDGDGDGVMNSDIKQGIDPRVRGPLPLCVDGSLVCLGFSPSGVNDPDSGEPVSSAASPLHFNKSTLCSFGPTADATPGTLYFTNGIDTWALRSSGASGRIYLMKYNRSSGHWESHDGLPG